MRAQKLFLRAASFSVFGLGAGGLSLEPVAALYLARPFAVSPAPLDIGSFSPRPTDRDTFLGIFRRRCKGSVWLLNPTDVAQNVSDIHKRCSLWGRVWRHAVPFDDVQNDFRRIFNDCVSHCLEVSCHNHDAIGSISTSTRVANGIKATTASASASTVSPSVSTRASISGHA